MMPTLRLSPRHAATALTIAALCAAFAPAAHAEIRVTDDAGRSVVLPQPARRIVSLAPHVTELLYAAGAGAQVVGAVSYSDYPEAAKTLPRVGGYSSVDLEAVAALKPDLVIAWKSGNRNTHLDRLTALGIPVYVNEPRHLDDVATSLRALGQLAGTSAAAEQAATRFAQRRDELRGRYAQRPRVRMFYQIWNQPLMTVNGEHLISDMIRLCGGDNVFAALPQLAPNIGVEAVLAANPEVIVASGMGESRPEWLDQWKRWPALAANAAGNLFFIPPEIVQRHTPRILDGAQRLCEQLEEARAKRSAAPR